MKVRLSKGVQQPHHAVAAAQDDIVKVRDAETQTERIGVPEEHLGGHAFHTYRQAPSRCARSTKDILQVAAIL